MEEDLGTGLELPLLVCCSLQMTPLLIPGGAWSVFHRACVLVTWWTGPDNAIGSNRSCDRIQLQSRAVFVLHSQSHCFLTWNTERLLHMECWEDVTHGMLRGYYTWNAQRIIKDGMLRGYYTWNAERLLSDLNSKQGITLLLEGPMDHTWWEGLRKSWDNRENSTFY